MFGCMYIRIYNTFFVCKIILFPSLLVYHDELFTVMIFLLGHVLQVKIVWHLYFNPGFNFYTNPIFC